MNSILTLRDVTKNYPKFSLQQVSLELPPGAIMGLIGPNGSGKSTMLKAIMNLVRLDGGEIKVFGLDSVRDEVAIKAQVGFVSDEFPFYEDFDGKRLARFMAPFYPTWDEALFAKLAGHFRVDLGQAYGKLSKGNKMKLALCLAMAHKPRLLLLDEPTTGLDPLVRRELLDQLMEVIADEGRSVLFSSHITSDVERVADYLTVITDGRIRFSGVRDDLQDRWRRILSPTPFPEEVVRWLVAQEERFGGYAGVTGDFAALAEAWPEGLPEGAKVEGMSLEDILIALARGGKGYVADCG